MVAGSRKGFLVQGLHDTSEVTRLPEEKSSVGFASLLFVFNFKGEGTYPAQSLQQEGFQAVTPPDQILLQLLIVQGGQ